ncbi:flagellar biosynthetic protein FliO [Terrabacter sp. NPDC080008]|uniref:flagellar biosynthetic protein FliO n=1 Tax=Terrabacter sp. NPDC080008 TaxID=3155176 RepID=UPI00344C28CB
MDSLLLGLRVVVSLAAVFGLMWLVQRKLRGTGAALRTRVLNVVARQNVGPKASVVLVDTDGKRFLLGVTEHGISVLHTSDAPAPTIPDPHHDAVAGDGALTTPATRRSLRHASFESELERQRHDVLDGLPTAEDLSRSAHAARDTRATRAGRAGRPAGTGSVLDPGTWRLAAEALRSGRRP